MESKGVAGVNNEIADQASSHCLGIAQRFTVKAHDYEAQFADFLRGLGEEENGES